MRSVRKNCGRKASARSCAIWMHKSGGVSKFLRSAAACLDTTEVPVEGTLTIKRAGPGGALIVNQASKGNLLVIGTKLERARLRLSSGENSVDVNYSHPTRSFRVESLSLPGA